MHISPFCCLPLVVVVVVVEFSLVSFSSSRFWWLKWLGNPTRLTCLSSCIKTSNILFILIMYTHTQSEVYHTSISGSLLTRHRCDVWDSCDTHALEKACCDWLTDAAKSVRFQFGGVSAHISLSLSRVDRGKNKHEPSPQRLWRGEIHKKTQTRHETRLRMPSPNRRRKTHSRNQITWHDMCFKIMLMSEAVAFLCRSVHIASSAGLKNHPQHCADVASVCLPTRVCERVLSTHHNRFERQLKREIFMRRHTSRRRCARRASFFSIRVQQLAHGVSSSCMHDHIPYEFH